MDQNAAKRVQLVNALCRMSDALDEPANRNRVGFMAVHGGVGMGTSTAVVATATVLDMRHVLVDLTKFDPHEMRRPAIFIIDAPVPADLDRAVDTLTAAARGSMIVVMLPAGVNLEAAAGSIGVRSRGQHVVHFCRR